MRVVLYFACLVFVVVYAWRRGGRPEQAGALVLLLGSLLTMAAGSPAILRFASIEFGILVVDLMVLAAFLALALSSDRYWPLWTAALQLIGVLAHLAKAADLEMPRFGYAFLQAVWSYPMMLTIVIGTQSFQRTRLLRHVEGT